MYRGRRGIPRTTSEAGPPLSHVPQTDSDSDDWGISAPVDDAAGEEQKNKVLDTIIERANLAANNNGRFVFPEELNVDVDEADLELPPHLKQFAKMLAEVERKERRIPGNKTRFVISDSSGDEDDEEKPAPETICCKKDKECPGVKKGGKCLCDTAYENYRRWVESSSVGEPSFSGGGGRGNHGRRTRRY